MSHAKRKRKGETMTTYHIYRSVEPGTFTRESGPDILTHLAGQHIGPVKARSQNAAALATARQWAADGKAGRHIGYDDTEGHDSTIYRSHRDGSVSRLTMEIERGSWTGRYRERVLA